ncbi:MAG TPA: hypothetical protein VK550_30360 [Polyangiaceae bacterium]|nr:hypothetical protein [Polyangiaceae bacterium]
MILRRATATVLVSIGVAAALFEGCSGTDNPGSTTRSTSSGTGNGTTSTGAGGATGSGTTGGGNAGGGTTTGGGGTVGPIDPGNPEAGADIKVTADAACASTATTGEKKPTDLLIMMDSSGSMDTVDPGQTNTRWINVSEAIPPFVADPANAGMMIGLDFFPETGGGGGNNLACTPADYSNPDVPIGLIPGMNNMQAMALGAAVMNRRPNNSTPTVPALTGALQTAKAWQLQNPTRSISVLLMTDGIPMGCTQNSVTNAAAVAQMYSNGMPPIKTFVLGVGPDTGPLDTIAAGGGTMKAFMVTNGGAAGLSQALADIRKSTLACDYAIPKPEAGTLDPNKVVVSVREGTSGNFIDIPNVVSAAGCISSPMNPSAFGWYYDNPAMPTKITLCPNSCGPLQITDGSEVKILLGCEPKRIPPPN